MEKKEQKRVKLKDIVTAGAIVGFTLFMYGLNKCWILINQLTME